MKKHIHYLLCLMLFLCTACQTTQEQRHQRLTINFQEGDLPSLHPHDLVIYLRGLSLAKHLYEPLTRIDHSGNIALAGAKSISISPDQLQYTFILRENHWSDGSPVTAYHYANAWKAALHPLSTCSRADLLYTIKNAERAKKGDVAMDAVGIQALDDKTLVIDLAYPCPHFLELTTQCITAPLVDPSHRETLVYNGPFVVDEWKKGHSLHLKPNPYYWKKQDIALQMIDIFFIEDASTAYTLFEKGELDWVGVPLSPLSAEQALHLQEKSALKRQMIGRSFWVFLNTQHPTLSSSLVRQALSLAIDREAVTRHILMGGEPSQKPLSHQLLAIDVAKPLQENVEEAKRLFELGLQDLGYTPATFPGIEISYSQQANRKQFAEYLQERWQNIFGIRVRLQPTDWNTLRSNLEKGLYTVSMAYEGAYYRDPLELLERYTVEQPSNFSKWLHTEFGQKIAQAKCEKDMAIRAQLLSQAESILIEEMPFIPICSDRLLFAHAPHLTGFVIDSLGAVDFTRASFSTQ